MSVSPDSVRSVKQVIKLRMLPTAEQAAALQATLSTCNEAASWLSGRMHADRVCGKHEVQKWFYAELKRRFGLSAQPAIRVICKVADAYTTLKANIDAGNYGPPGSQKRKQVTATPIGFRTDAAQPFDARCLSWQIPEEVGGRRATVSIWTMAGRLKGIRILAAPSDLVMLRTRSIGETDLICTCGWVDKRNRRSQAEFECGRCGFVGHADHNAAINIAARGVERWGEVMRPYAAPTLTAS